MLNKGMDNALALPGTDEIAREALAFAPAAVLALLLFIGVILLRRLAASTIEDASRRYRARKLITYFGAFLVAILLLSAASSQVARLSVAIAAIGAAAVFALQEVIASIAGWIALSFGGFFRPGDRIELGGIKGDVIDIGVLRTTLMEIGAWVDGDQYSGRMVRVANSFVFKQPVFNYSAEFPFVWDEIKLPVRYGSDLELAKKLILDAAEAEVGGYTEASQDSWKHVTRRFMIEQARIEPRVTVKATDNWMGMTLRYITDYKLRRSTADKITRRILAAIDASEGKVKLASATYEIVGVPKIEVEVGKSGG
jgi:small-conductance mechanosensitive channel